jgi:hypothetical protein
MEEIHGLSPELIPDLSDLTEGSIYSGPMITATNRLCIETGKLSKLLVDQNISADILASYMEVVAGINTILYLTILMHSRHISRLN